MPPRPNLVLSASRSVLPRSGRRRLSTCVRSWRPRGGISEDEFAEYTADLNAQIENLQLLISSAEADLDAHEEERLAAATTEAWLLTLRQHLAEVEADTDEARRQRRELVALLVEKITVSEQEDGSAEVHITYRFGEPVAEDISHGQRNSNVFPA